MLVLCYLSSLHNILTLPRIRSAAGRPAEGTGVLVVGGDVILDGPVQVGDALKDPRRMAGGGWLPALESPRRGGREFRKSDVKGLSLPRVQAGRDTWSLVAALGEIIFQRTVMQWLAAGAFEPCHILGIFHPLQEFLIVLNGNDHGNGFAFARDDFRFMAAFIF
jgi:hypothetical protein